MAPRKAVLKSATGLLPVYSRNSAISNNGAEVPDTLAPQEMQIIAALEQAEGITTAEVMTLLAVKERRARDILNSMAEKHLLLRQGNARSTRYVRGKP